MAYFLFNELFCLLSTKILYVPKCSVLNAISRCIACDNIGLLSKVLNQPKH